MGGWARRGFEEFVSAAQGKLQIARARLADFRDGLAVERAVDELHVVRDTELTCDLSPITLQHSSVLSVSAAEALCVEPRNVMSFSAQCMCRTYMSELLSDNSAIL